MEIDIQEKRIVNNPWSGQKKLKFGYYDPISINEASSVLKEIQMNFNETLLQEMEDLLLNPTKDEIESLIWVPDRLKKPE